MTPAVSIPQPRRRRPRPGRGCLTATRLHRWGEDMPEIRGWATTSDDDRRPAPVVGSRQRRWLRGRAHALEPVTHVGAAGVTDAVLRAVDHALDAHELVKVRLHEPEDKKADARALAEGTGAALCGLVGHTVILYRPHPETPRIVVP